MNCAVCSKPVEVERHDFFAGSPRRPSRQWQVYAPAYFKATADFTGVIEGYCSAKCSVIGHARAA